METFWFFWLRFRRVYDSAYDSDFWFPQGHKRSYDSDSVASENQSRLYFRSRDILSTLTRIAFGARSRTMETYHHWQVWTCYVHVGYLWSHEPITPYLREKNMKTEKRPTKTTKLPVILNNFKSRLFNLEIVKNGWKETCAWFTLKLEFFLRFLSKFSEMTISF